MSAFRTRFSRSSPLIYRMELFSMFNTLIFQHCEELIRCKVANLASPQSFHTVNVKCFGNDNVKTPTKSGGKFPLPIKTLVSNFPIMSCELADCSIPVVRTFTFATQRFIQRPQCIQGLFQKLWCLYLITIAQCQKRLQSEVYTNALTCVRKGFGRSVVRDNTKPIVASSVTKDLDIADISVPLTMLMERIPDFIKLQLLFFFMPRLKRDTDTSVLKFVSTWELSRTIPVFSFVFRFTRFILKEPILRIIKSDNNSVKCVTWYPSPMFVGGMKAFRKMWLQSISASIFTINPIIPIFKSKKIVVDISKFVQHITKFLVLLVRAYFVFVCSHGFTVSVKFLYPFVRGVQMLTTPALIQY